MSSFKHDAGAGAELTAQWQERNETFLPVSQHNTLKLSAFDTKGFVAFTKKTVGPTDMVACSCC